MTSSPKALWITLSLLICAALLAGCNDILRQFIITVPKPGGTPGSLSNAVILSTNPAGNGSNLHIDVSGDNIAAEVMVGLNPKFLGKAGGSAIVINGDNTVTSYPALSALGTNPRTGTLPASVSNPVGGSGAGALGNFFLADNGSNDVTVLLGGIGAASQVVPVGTGPVAAAGNNVISKVYVVNNGSTPGTVTVISTVDNSVFKTIQVGAQPIWDVMSADGIDVFVVNQGDNTVSVIDTNLDQVIATVPVGPSPNFAFFEPNRQRVYVSNTGNNTVSVIKADGINLGVTPQILPVLLANVPVSGTPVSVTALSDGSKAYAALGNCPSGTNHTTLLANLGSCNGSLVSVIDALALRETKTIQVGPGAVSINSSGDASRVYVVSANDTTTVHDNVHNPACPNGQACGPVGAPHCTANCIGGAIQPDEVIPTSSVSIIRTSTDSLFLSTPPPTDPSVTVSPFSFRAPLQNATCTPALNASFNQTVPIPCPGQTAFMVTIFP